jgi:hypothetical protein
MSRPLGAAVLLAILLALEFVVPTAFPLLVSVALIGGSSINWQAFWRLRSHYLADPSIVSLRTAYFAATLLAIASTSLAFVGILVAARAVNLIDAIPREVVLIGLSFPALLMTGPALDWLLTFRGTA